MATILSTRRMPVSRPLSRTRTGNLIVWLSETFLGWLDRARERRALEALDDRLLKDIGLTRADVAHEVDQPFWRN